MWCRCCQGNQRCSSSSSSSSTVTQSRQARVNVRNLCWAVRGSSSERTMKITRLPREETSESRLSFASAQQQTKSDCSPATVAHCSPNLCPVRPDLPHLVFRGLQRLLSCWRQRQRRSTSTVGLTEAAASPSVDHGQPS